MYIVHHARVLSFFGSYIRKSFDISVGVVSLFLSLRVDRMYDHHLAWNEKFAENDTAEYQQLEYEAGKAVSKIFVINWI